MLSTIVKFIVIFLVLSHIQVIQSQANGISVNSTIGCSTGCLVDGKTYQIDRFGERLTLSITNSDGSQSGFGALYVTIRASQDISTVIFECSRRVVNRTEGPTTFISRPTDQVQILNNSLILNGSIEWCSWSILRQNGKLFPFDLIEEPELITMSDDYQVIYRLDRVKPSPPLDVSRLPESLKPMADPSSGFKIVGNSRYILFEKSYAASTVFIFAILPDDAITYKPDSVFIGLENIYGIHVECNYQTKSINGSRWLGGIVRDHGLGQFITDEDIYDWQCSWTIPNSIDFGDLGKLLIKERPFNLSIEADKRFNLLQVSNINL